MYAIWLAICGFFRTMLAGFSKKLYQVNTQGLMPPPLPPQLRPDLLLFDLPRGLIFHPFGSPPGASLNLAFTLDREECRRPGCAYIVFREWTCLVLHMLNKGLFSSYLIV